MNDHLDPRPADAGEPGASRTAAGAWGTAPAEAPEAAASFPPQPPRASDRRAIAGTAVLAVVAVGMLVAGIRLGQWLRSGPGASAGDTVPAPAAPGMVLATVAPAGPGGADSAGVSSGVVEPGRASLGEPAPDFALETPDGDKLALADFAGKPVILNFWATWCRPCQIEMPYLQTAHNLHAEKGLVVLGVDVGERSDVVKPFLEQLGLTFPVVLDQNSRVADQYRVYSYPTTYLIDRDGRVVNIRRGIFANQFDLDQSVGLILPEAKAE